MPISGHLVVLILALLCAWSQTAAASEFVINPLQVGLDRTRKAGEFVVRNEGTEPLRMQLQAMSWRQDGNGKDQYEPDDSLMFFPRSMEIPSGASRVVRVGVKAAPVTREETYRLFVEELPSATPSLPTGPGASLQVLLRVGVAIYVAPAKVEHAGSIETLEQKGGEIAWTVANTGNVHFRADRVELVGSARDGTHLFSRSFDERYFLAGTTKRLKYVVPQDACGRLAIIEAVVAGENLDLKRKVDVDPGSCR